MSEEHYLPDGLGRFCGYKPLIGKVCSSCNRKIGEIEEPFLRTGYIAAFRRQLGIKGKDGSPPSPYERGASGIPRLRATGRILDFPYEVLLEGDFGATSARPLRQIIFREQRGEIHQFYVPDWMLSDSAKFIESLQVEGLEHALPVHGFAHPEEISVLETLLTSSNFPVPKKWNEAGNEFTPGSVSVTLEAPLGFEPFVRSVAKIAFHYTLKVFSDLSGNEPEFRAIKEFIWSGGENRFVEQVRRRELIQPPTCWSHFIFVKRSYEEIVARVHLFVPPPGAVSAIPPPFSVRVGRSPSRIVRRVEQRAHQFAMSQLDVPSGPIGEMVDLFGPC
jgi:hypothetical protein